MIRTTWFNHHWPDAQTCALIPIWCISFHPSIRREVITVLYLLTRDLKNLVLKVLCYHVLTSEPIPLNSSCLVTPCLCIGFTESASTVILCCSQPSYSYFNCRPPASSSPWVTARNSWCHINYKLTFFTPQSLAKPPSLTLKWPERCIVQTFEQRKPKEPSQNTNCKLRKRYNYFFVRETVTLNHTLWCHLLLQSQIKQSEGQKNLLANLICVILGS